jgi:hypothetical protein
MIASVFSALPAQAATEIPAVVQIEDPSGDANYLNDSNASPLGRDNVTPADASSFGDLLKIWFSNDAEKVSVHFLTEAVPPAGNAVGFQVYTNPGEGEAGSSTLGCLRFVGIIPGTNPGGGSYQGPPFIRLHDRCNTGGTLFNDSVEGEFITEEAEGGGITTLTFPRSASPLLGAAATLTAPYAASSSPLVGASGVGFQFLTVDNTKVGTDYTVGGGGSAGPPATEEPPAEEPEEKPKKNCKKKKGKAKKKCKKAAGEAPGGGAPGQACPAYVPGEQGAEAESVVVTDEHTEEAPLELTIEQEVGLANDLVLGQYDGTAHTFRNLQLDSAAAEAGLYMRYEFPAYEDHDLYVNYADGSEAAHVGGFNATPVGPFDGTGFGGHSETGAEQIDGLRTADCAGYTIDFSNYLGEGGEYTVKVWLGEILNDPAPPGEGKRISQF